MDIFERIRQNRGPLGQFASYGDGYFIFPKLEGELGARMKFKGKDVICWSLNNYLGLANHPEIRKIDAQASLEYGLAYPMGARAMSGHTDKHEELENNLAEFVGKEACYLLNFGYQGMLSIIDSLLSPKDVVVYDNDCHACIVDGVRLHLGKRFTYQHNDAKSLEKMLIRAGRIAEKTDGGILVISEGVFGMRGEQGNLKEIVELKQKYNFRLLVDDAHGFGTLGKTGAGTGEEQGVQNEIDIYFSTFAKSMASVGAFVAGEKNMIEYLKYNMRSQIFAKSLPMPLVIGALKRLDMLKNKPELKEKLWENTNKLQQGLREAGFDLGKTTTCVTPVFLHGSTVEGTLLVKDLRENYGIFTSIVVYPVIPKGMILLRLIPTAAHTNEDIKETIAAFGEIRNKLKSGIYAEMEKQMNVDYQQY